jgi:retinol dehydrogenase-12
MTKDSVVHSTVLITGGTSGLGLALVKTFLEKGFTVVATGRRPITMSGFERAFHIFLVDLSDLEQTAAVTKKICDKFDFNIVVNNAGILSPKGCTKTNDGFEYTYQVNFLAHLLINEIIISRHNKSRQLKISAVTSSVYKIAKHDLKFAGDETCYKPLKAYSDSKLFLALMCKHLAEKYSGTNISFLGFIPGVFASSIYRMQSPLFRNLYRIAAPFMRKPSEVAGVLADFLTDLSISSGTLYNVKKEKKDIPLIEASVLEAFWNESYAKIERFLFNY